MVKRTFLALLLLLAYCPHGFAYPKSCEMRLQAATDWFERIPREYQESLSRAYKAHAKTFERAVEDVLNGYIKLDYGADLYKRLAAGESYPKTLLRLGMKISESDQRVHAPERLEEIYFRFNLEIQSRIDSGRLSESDAIFTGLFFVKEGLSTRRRSAKSLTREDFIILRPGIDEIPDLSEYEPVLEVPQFSSKVWAQILAGGIMPFGVGSMIAHDLTHLSELYESPEYMAAFRAYHRFAVKQPEGWHERFDYGNVTHDWVPPLLRSHVGRVTVFTEELNTPDLRRAKQIRRSMPELFRGKKPLTFDEHLAYLKDLPEAALKKRIARAVKLYGRFIVRNGGGMRDPFNNVREFSDAANLESARENLVGPARKVSRSDGSRFRRAKIESLFAMHAVLTRYADVEVLARLEVGIANAIRFGITNAQVVRDSAGLVLDPASPTAQYFTTFAKPGSFLWEAFVSPAAFGQPSLDPVRIHLESLSYLTPLVQIHHDENLVRLRRSETGGFVEFQFAPDGTLTLPTPISESIQQNIQDQAPELPRDRALTIQEALTAFGIQ